MYALVHVTNDSMKNKSVAKQIIGDLEASPIVQTQQGFVTQVTSPDMFLRIMSPSAYYIPTL